MNAVYTTFLANKQVQIPAIGPTVAPGAISDALSAFQQDLVRWAVHKGRAALFADTGLGKTRMQIEWARLIGGNTLILAPLAVAQQTVEEAKILGLHINYARQWEDVQPGINITTYGLAHHFDPAYFQSVVLDESSILKSLEGKTRKALTEQWGNAQYRLCCTATPAPNDTAEIANHAEFLGICTRAEMLAQFFVHDDDGWRLKGHASQAFYRWLASWGMSLRKPSDLGYSDEGYNLPPLTIDPVWVDTDYAPPGQLFFTGLHGIQDRTAVRKATTADRVRAAADIVNAGSGAWVVWCGLDAESRAMTAAIPGAVEVKGSDLPAKKETALKAFAAGEIRVLVTKPRIAGFGLNWQHCHQQVFVGLDDSYEAYYQCIRRCWRFGQKEPVNVYVVLAAVQDAIYQNILRKEEEAHTMQDQLLAHVVEYERAELAPTNGTGWEYDTDTVELPHAKLMLGDSAERLKEIATDGIHFSVYSPPFKSLFTYSPTERDLGNCRTSEEFYEHYGYIIREVLRVTMPGRITAVHVADIPAMMVRDGYIGMKDFPGEVIRAYETGGWIYHGRITIDKDPQAQAIRVRAKGLAFQQLHKDSSWMRPALADVILLFRKPGDNPIPIIPDITNDDWIEWARPIWYGIRGSDTLQYMRAKEDADERHICPLQLGTIERCIRLWSNPGETILTPFLGIGSEAYEAVRLGREAVGIELKRSYWQAAVNNVKSVIAEKGRRTLFDMDALTVRQPVEIAS